MSKPPSPFQRHLLTALVAGAHISAHDGQLWYNVGGTRHLARPEILVRCVRAGWLTEGYDLTDAGRLAANDYGPLSQSMRRVLGDLAAGGLLREDPQTGTYVMVPVGTMSYTVPLGVAITLAKRGWVGERLRPNHHPLTLLGLAAWKASRKDQP